MNLALPARSSNTFPVRFRDPAAAEWLGDEPWVTLPSGSSGVPGDARAAAREEPAPDWIPR